MVIVGLWFAKNYGYQHCRHCQLMYHLMLHATTFAFAAGQCQGIPKSFKKEVDTLV